MSEWTELLTLEIDGVAEPRGSKTAMPVYDRRGKPVMVPTKSGRMRVKCRMVDDNPRSGPWMEVVKAEAKLAWGNRPLWDGPVFLDLTVYRGRHDSHYRSDGITLKPNAPVLPGTKPDLSKLVRGIEDAMTKAVYTDDSRITDHRTKKRFGPPHVVITLYGGPKTMQETWDHEQQRLCGCD